MYRYKLRHLQMISCFIRYSVASMSEYRSNDQLYNILKTTYNNMKYRSNKNSKYQLCIANKALNDILKLNELVKKLAILKKEYKNTSNNKGIIEEQFKSILQLTSSAIIKEITEAISKDKPNTHTPGTISEWEFIVTTTLLSISYFYVASDVFRVDQNILLSTRKLLSVCIEWICAYVCHLLPNSIICIINSLTNLSNTKSFSSSYDLQVSEVVPSSLLPEKFKSNLVLFVNAVLSKYLSSAPADELKNQVALLRIEAQTPVQLSMNLVKPIEQILIKETHLIAHNSVSKLISGTTDAVDVSPGGLSINATYHNEGLIEFLKKHLFPHESMGTIFLPYECVILLQSMSKLGVLPTSDMSCLLILQYTLKYTPVLSMNFITTLVECLCIFIEYSDKASDTKLVPFDLLMLNSLIIMLTKLNIAYIKYEYVLALLPLFAVIHKYLKVTGKCDSPGHPSGKYYSAACLLFERAVDRVLYSLTSRSFSHKQAIQVVQFLTGMGYYPSGKYMLKDPLNHTVVKHAYSVYSKVNDRLHAVAKFMRPNHVIQLIACTYNTGIVLSCTVELILSTLQRYSSQYLTINADPIHSDIPIKQYNDVLKSVPEYMLLINTVLNYYFKDRVYQCDSYNKNLQIYVYKHITSCIGLIKNYMINNAPSTVLVSQFQSFYIDLQLLLNRAYAYLIMNYPTMNTQSSVTSTRVSMNPPKLYKYLSDIMLLLDTNSIMINYSLFGEISPSLKTHEKSTYIKSHCSLSSDSLFNVYSSKLGAYSDLIVQPDKSVIHNYIQLLNLKRIDIKYFEMKKISSKLLAINEIITEQIKLINGKKNKINLIFDLVQLNQLRYKLNSSHE